MTNFYTLRTLFFLLFTGLFSVVSFAQTCTWTVKMSGSYGDQISWELRNSEAEVLLSGGGYTWGFSDEQTIEAEGPLSFYIETNGTWLDNVVNFYISNENGIVVASTLTGGLEEEYTDLNCDDPELATSEGCLDAFYGAYTEDVYVPACAGIEEALTAYGFAGQYNFVQLTGGTQYIFSSSIETDFITISDQDGEQILASGIGNVMWIADTDQIVRFYTHADAYCNYVNTFRVREIMCGDAPEPPSNPDYDCFQGDALEERDNAFSIYEGDLWRNVDDFLVEDETTFDLQYIRLNVSISNSNVNTMFFQILADNNGIPSNEILYTTEVFSEPVSEIMRGYTPLGFAIYELSYVLSEPIELPAGRYWILPQGTTMSDTGIYWELTDSGTNGNYVYTSEQNGDWIADERNYNGVFFVAGECDEVLSTNDISTNDFSYFPNPVKNELNIDSKINVSTISVLDIEGKLIIDNLKLKSGKVDLSSLNNGVYIIKAVLENQSLETFKILKK